MDRDEMTPPPSGYRSPTTGRALPDYSYYAGRAELISWVNNLLDLSLSRLEEFASGAVYCQMLDAYFSDTVPMHKVNFFAHEEYEYMANYKQLQAGLTVLGMTRELDLHKLMRGAPTDSLEFLQWLYKYLRKKRLDDTYDPRARRASTIRGGTDKLPPPFWDNQRFDVYGRDSLKTHYEHVDGEYPDPAPMRKSRASPGHHRRKERGVHRMTSGDQSSAAPTETTESRLEEVQEVDEFEESEVGDKAESQEPPMDEATSEKRAPSPVGYSVDIRAVSSETRVEDRPAPVSRSYQVPSEVSAGAVEAITDALSTLQKSMPKFKGLLGDMGAENDSYAYRGKVRSMRDVFSTLMRHCAQLLDDLEGLHKIQPIEAEDLSRLSAAANEMARMEDRFRDVVGELRQAEETHPVPQKSTISITEEQKGLSDTKALDGTLRRVGAAQAALAQALLKGSVEGSRAILDAVKQDPTKNGKDRSEDDPPKKESLSRTIRIGDFQMRRLKNGDIYKGRYIRSKKNGEGVYQFMNGDVYEGDFKDDRMGGNGLYTFSHEGRYEGQWENAVYEGVGTETFARGSTYHGEYSGGMRSGWGVCRYYNGDYYEGVWKQGLRDGRGMQQCTDDSNYVGDYLAGKRHGFGVYSFPNGDRYLGEYEKDIPHGYGVYMFASGQKYEGQWHAGKKHGWCIYTIETGEQWAGEWVEGKPKWVQGLVDGEEMDKRWTDEICEKVKMAWKSCKSAQGAAKEGGDRADEHWATDGATQKAIRDVIKRANEAAAAAQDARKKAIEVAAKLDTLAANQENSVTTL
ncbi:unnamed protein product [Ostreobium quekettii]|uniref:Calponin-homology (CH) domain-containing protein n=1 Tax=Ostreobium quekettii TaxID=121088 RepID=A0A8S1IZ98_9CHLO|nr:unnamed protein product [Ostreobium quekettii]|eukprot:evm.model.scf_380EXC.6 EVM.evm.TU.scf_380EXC.6   scf_380EXC:57977-69940(-)